MKEGNSFPCQMANKRSVSLYILETRWSVCRPCSTYHEQHQTAQSLLPCHDSECCSTALSTSGFLANLLEPVWILLASSRGVGTATTQNHAWVFCSLKSFSTEWFSPTSLSLLFLGRSKFLLGQCQGSVIHLAGEWAHSQGAAHQKLSPSTASFVFGWQWHPLESRGGWMGLKRKLMNFPSCISQDPYFSAAWEMVFSQMHIR